MKSSPAAAAGQPPSALAVAAAAQRRSVGCWSQAVLAVASQGVMWWPRPPTAPSVPSASCCSRMIAQWTEPCLRVYRALRPWAFASAFASVHCCPQCTRPCGPGLSPPLLQAFTVAPICLHHATTSRNAAPQPPRSSDFRGRSRALSHAVLCITQQRQHLSAVHLHGAEQQRSALPISRSAAVSQSNSSSSRMSAPVKILYLSFLDTPHH
eukprot:COSAG01_NODE_8640_length_2711_cov_8.702144_4_plen_210_part_00